MNLHLKLGNKNIIHDYNIYCKDWIEGASDEWREVKGDFRRLPRKRLGVQPGVSNAGGQPLPGGPPSHRRFTAKSEQ